MLDTIVVKGAVITVAPPMNNGTVRKVTQKIHSPRGSRGRATTIPVNDTEDVGSRITRSTKRRSSQPESVRGRSSVCQNENNAARGRSLSPHNRGPSTTFNFPELEPQSQTTESQSQAPEPLTRVRERLSQTPLQSRTPEQQGPTSSKSSSPNC